MFSITVRINNFPLTVTVTVNNSITITDNKHTGKLMAKTRCLQEHACA